MIGRGTEALAPPRARPAPRWRLTRTQFSLLLLTPALLLLAATVLYPLLRGVYLSFQSYSLISPIGRGFVGFKNYDALLGNATYWETWRTTGIFVAASVGGQFLLGFVTALVLNNAQIRQRNLFRGLLLVPWIVPTVVASLLWKWIFNQQYGVFNYVLHAAGIIPGFKAWIGDPELALPSVVLANIWKGFPFHMIILLAALQTVPHDVVEAAVIDGATAAQRFRHIVLPSLRYIIMIDLLISIIWTFQNFTLIWTMTEGGPIDSTMTLAISIYRTAFQSFDMGMGAAIGTMWLAALAVFSVVFVRFVGGTSRAEL